MGSTPLPGAGPGPVLSQRPPPCLPDPRLFQTAHLGRGVSLPVPPTHVSFLTTPNHLPQMAHSHSALCFPICWSLCLAHASLLLHPGKAPAAAQAEFCPRLLKVAQGCRVQSGCHHQHHLSHQVTLSCEVPQVCVEPQSPRDSPHAVGTPY